MAALDVGFEWPVCDEGYRLKPPPKKSKPTKPKKKPSIVLSGFMRQLPHETLLEKVWREIDASPKIVPKGKSERWHRPLEIHKTLYGDFAKLDGSGKSCIEFASRFGLLGLGNTGGEPLVMWQEAITWMTRVIELSQSDPKALEGYQIAPLRGSLVQGPPNGRLALRFGPDSLLHGMQLQFAQAVSSGLTIKECRLCGKWFEAGGDLRRRDAQFCSKEHKIAFHNLEKRR